jgi:hypothetical protein
MSSSFRDPSGFVYRENGKVLRQVNESCRENYELLMESGLYQELVDYRFLIPHRQVDTPSFLERNGFCVLEPEQIAYISHPYEWCFSQIKDAALLTLAIQKIALAHGMTLKDASAYNIQFRGSQPVFIDTLSFERFEEKPWVAYKQFCQHFVAPLALTSYGDYRLTGLLKSYIDGIPLDLAAKLLPARTRFSLGLLMHIHLHAKSQKKYANKGQEREVQDKVTSSRMPVTKAIAIVDQLTSTVKALKWSMVESEWGNYYQNTNYQDTSLDEKSSIIRGYIQNIGMERPSIQDLGANDGKFGRAVSSLASIVVCHDIDETVVEKNYLAAKADKDMKILPLVQNLANPSPAMGWANEERDNLIDRGPLGVSMALALIHHLAISNNVPLDLIAGYFSRLSRYLIIEFVSKQDSQVLRLLSTREDVFPHYTQEGFETAFSNSFELIQIDQIQSTERTLYLMKSLVVE